MALTPPPLKQCQKKLQKLCGVLSERRPPSQDGEALVQRGQGRQLGSAQEQPPGDKEGEPGFHLLTVFNCPKLLSNYVN